MQFLILIGLVGLAIASIFDIKTREVPDWLSYGLIVIGVGIRAIYSVMNENLMFLITGVAAGIALFLAGMGMYYARQWGGGDTKLLAGLGILFMGEGLGNNFLIWFLVNLLLVGGIYGVAFGMILAVKNKNKFLREFKEEFKKGKRMRRIGMGIAAGLVLLVLLIDEILLKMLMILIGFVVLIYPYMFMFMKAVENSSMFKRIKTENLTEGDWVKEVRIGEKVIVGKKCPGIDKKQIEELKRNKIKEVIVREGIPFVPSFLIAGITTLIFGNIIGYFI